MTSTRRGVKIATLKSPRPHASPTPHIAQIPAAGRHPGRLPVRRAPDRPRGPPSDLRDALTSGTVGRSVARPAGAWTRRSRRAGSEQGGADAASTSRADAVEVSLEKGRGPRG